MLCTGRDISLEEGSCSVETELDLFETDEVMFSAPENNLIKIQIRPEVEVIFSSLHELGNICSLGFC